MDLPATSKIKKINKWKIIHWTIITVLVILTTVFTILLIIDQARFIVGFLVVVFCLGLYVVFYFLVHFLFTNREEIKTQAKKLVTDYQKEPPASESKEEKIKRLENELAKLKKEKED